LRSISAIGKDAFQRPFDNAWIGCLDVANLAGVKDGLSTQAKIFSSSSHIPVWNVRAMLTLNSHLAARLRCVVFISQPAASHRHLLVGDLGLRLGVGHGKL
jgi:hypothetical protein